MAESPALLHRTIISPRRRDGGTVLDCIGGRVVPTNPRDSSLCPAHLFACVPVYRCGSYEIACSCSNVNQMHAGLEIHNLCTPVPSAPCSSPSGRIETETNLERRLLVYLRFMDTEPAGLSRSRGKTARGSSPRGLVRNFASGTRARATPIVCYSNKLNLQSTA